MIALLIGIDDAPLGEGLANLGAAVSDVRLLEEVLIKEVGVPSSNIEMLLNRNATRQTTLNALDHLRRISQARDTVVVAYAGHGGAEETGSGGSSYLFTHKERTATSELLAMLSRVPARKRLLLIDACRSGGAASRPFRLSVQDLEKARNLAYIASCGAGEESHEIRRGDRWEGLFFAEVARVLAAAAQFDDNHNRWLDFPEFAGRVQEFVSQRAEAFGVRQRPIYALRQWQGDQGLVPARRKWTLEFSGVPRPQSRVDGIYDPKALGPSYRLWVVVAPRQSPGRYWPMDQPVTLLPGNRWESMACLGNHYDGAGQWFRILLVRADRSLIERFQKYFRSRSQYGNSGMTSPALHDLPIVAETESQRPR